MKNTGGKRESTDNTEDLTRRKTTEKSKVIWSKPEENKKTYRHY